MKITVESTKGMVVFNIQSSEEHEEFLKLIEGTLNLLKDFPINPTISESEIDTNFTKEAVLLKNDIIENGFGADYELVNQYVMTVFAKGEKFLARDIAKALNISGQLVGSQLRMMHNKGVLINDRETGGFSDLRRWWKPDPMNELLEINKIMKKTMNTELESMRER